MHSSHYQTILVSLDGSRFSETALDHAVPLAKGVGARLHLVRAIPPAPYLPPGVTYFGAIPLHPPLAVSSQEDQQHDQDIALEYLDGLKRRLQQDDLRCSYAARLGEKKDVILQEASDVSADMIVVASHQRSGLARYLAPNTSTLLSIEAKCPVLSVKGLSSAHYQEEHLYDRIHERLKPHTDQLAQVAGLTKSLTDRAVAPAVAMILAALAEEGRHGPDMRKLMQKMKGYQRGADDIGAFLAEGRSDVDLVAHVFHERGAKAAAILAKRVNGLTTNGAVTLLAFLSPIVLAELSLVAENDSELRRVLLAEVRNAAGPAELDMERAAGLVHSV